MARAEQKHTVGEFKLKSEKDIDSYSVFIAFLKLKYWNKLRENDKIAALFGISGEKYATTILSHQELIESREKGIIFNALIGGMYKQW